ncbi:hypothetical protein ACFY2R_06145 [Micromonospora olivasterospora]|uniref:hypothetical protein n=1 Tax=Micromonospora olivasterospora TaxID=1880 RepID=UPI00119E657C|nr:hypothetical protein [Micromonospora olivasterospora]
MARATLTATAATACLALAAPAWASAPLNQLAPGNGHNPKGDNGTVKIDGPSYTDSVDNEPHVTCEFELEFFNFDADQRAGITYPGAAPRQGRGQPHHTVGVATLTSQPPSKPKKVVWSVRNRVISTDPASGAENDHDEVIRLSARDLDLAGVEAHDKQGYHLKLDVDLVGGGSSGTKSKVFWLKPCADSTEPESPAPNPGIPGAPSADPSQPASGGETAPSPASGTGADSENGGSGGGLPVTGVAAPAWR